MKKADHWPTQMYPLQSVKSLQQDIHNHWSFCITTVLAISNWRTQRHRDSNLACNFSLWAVNVTAHLYRVFTQCDSRWDLQEFGSDMSVVHWQSTSLLGKQNHPLQILWILFALLSLWIYEDTGLNNLSFLWIDFLSQPFIAIGFWKFWLYVYFYNFAVY